MRGLRLRWSAWVAVGLFALALGGCADWVTYHNDGTRDGVDPDAGTAVAPTLAWRSQALDGQIDAEPLLFGSTVYVVTENDTVYALNATTGAIVWHTHVGTPVPASALPCGSITPTVGITGTPVIDSNTQTIYAVADTWDGSHAHHELVGFRLGDGSPVLTRAVDVPGPGGGANPEFVPENQLQRAALVLDGSAVIASFGGNNGDCAHYHGWVVASQENGAGRLLSYQVGQGLAGAVRGAVWNGGGGPALDSSGDLYVTTGNGGSTTTYDHGNSVIKLDTSLHELDHYAPSTWAADNAADLDLGSSNAVLLPGGLLFQAGKNGTGYLVATATGSMGGTGQAGQPDPSRFHSLVCSAGSFGGPAYAAGRIFVPCVDGLRALTLNSATAQFTPLWRGPSGAIGPPIIADGRVWTVGWGNGTLYGLDPASGAVVFQQAVPGVTHFTTPTSGDGRLILAAGNEVIADTISSSAASAPGSARRRR